MKHIYLLIVSCLLMISCEDFFETTLELEEPTFTEKLVVNSIITNLTLDEVHVLVSKTVGLNENLEESYVSDAIVTVTYPDGSVHNLNYIDLNNNYPQYNYQGQLPNLQPGMDYTIEVTQGETTVKSTTKMPPINNLISAKYLENGGLDEDGDEVSAIDIIIDDNPEESNYYKIGAIKIFDNFAEPLFLKSNNAFALQSASYQDLIINDDQFNGEEFKLRLQFYNYDFYEGEPDFAEYKVLLKSISKEQYDHDKLLYGFFENNDNPFASPVQLSTNIEGGLGLFAIENINIYDVDQ